jgi:endonuclease-3
MRRAARAARPNVRRETAAQKSARVLEILKRLRRARPGAKIELNHSNALELLVATILAAQCTDKRVNEVTKTLFRKYPNPIAYASADRAVLEQEIKSTGFFRNKTKSIIAACQKIVADHGGEVPATMDELLTLPGVARKTANVVLGNVFGIPSGIVVDTHIQRVAYRLGLTTARTPEQIEQYLMALLPKRNWIEFSTHVVLHGRYVCTARNPDCPHCPVEPLCPKIGL